MKNHLRLAHKSKYNWLVLLLVVAAIALIGLYIIFRSRAATNADINGDGTVGIADLSILASNYGKSGMTFAQGDINGDGVVGIADLSILAANWGTTTTVIQPTGLGQAGGPTGTWSKVDFDDEFNSTNAATCNNSCGLDTSKWELGWVGGTAPVQSQELECYEPSNVQITSGYLRLFATNQSQSCPKGGITTRPYSSGAVDTGPSRYRVTYGFIEARVWIDADASGNLYNWPAWWVTDGTYNSYTGEIDILEGLSGNATATLHPDGTIGSKKLTQGWHTLGADWETNGDVTVYYDGQQLGSTKHYSLTTAQGLVLGEQISQPGSYGGTIKVPSEMDIDYVRVWKH